MIPCRIRDAGGRTGCGGFPERGWEGDVFEEVFVFISVNLV